MGAPRPTGRSSRLARIAALCLPFGGLPMAAQAGCIHTNQLYSCVDAQGNSLQFYCFGAGEVQTCMDFSGGWVLVSPHEVLSQVTTSDSDSQLASALAARQAQQTSDSTTPQAPAPHVGSPSPTPGQPQRTH